MRKSLTLLMMCLLLFTTLALAQKEQAYSLPIPITVENAYRLAEIAEWQNTSSVTQVEFNPTDNSLALTQSDQSLGYGSIIFLNSTTLEQAILSKPISNATTFTFSPDGTLFAEIDDKGYLNVYKNQDFELLSHIEVGSEPILNLAIDPNNHYVAVAIGALERVTTEDAAFRLFQIDTGGEFLSLKREATDIDEIFGTGIVFDEEGENIFLSTSDGIIRRWNLATKEEAVIGEGALRGSQILTYSASYQIVYLTQEGAIRLVDWAGNKQDMATGQHKEARYFLASSIAIHPTEPLIAVSYIMPNSRTDKPATRDSLLQLWDSDSGKMLFETLVSEPGPNRLADLAFSTDGILLASGGTDGTVRLWGVPADS